MAYVDGFTDGFMIANAMKAAQWERAKGELRAMVALQGSYTATLRKETEECWRQLDAAVEAFISAVEDEGLQE